MRVFFRATLCFVFALLTISTLSFAQSTATLQGTVLDQSGAVVPNAQITITNIATNLSRTMQTDSAGTYQFAALPPGTYTVAVAAPNMQKVKIDQLKLDVSRTLGQNFTLKPASVSEQVTITSEAPVIETSTITVGQVVDQSTVQQIPLNGRHFVDLSNLVVGTLVPPVNGFLTAPLRGQGSFGVTTAGGREDTTNFMINGINLNDMANGQITFQPSVNTVSEFKMDNSTYSAEYGRNSGSEVNVATRSGTNNWHGEVFEFLRNNDFDARNFFNKRGTPMSVFKRNNFGASVGGPIFKNKTFFFASYEALRQRQGITVSTNVLTAAQRAQIVANNNATMQKLLPLIPVANDASGAKWLGSLVAPVNIDQGTIDLSHTFSDSDHIHGYYAIQHDIRKEPTLQGGNVPGAGDTRESRRQIMTLSETHVFSPRVVNDFRLGYNRIHILFGPDSNLNPADLGINNGINAPIGIPQISVGGLGLTFGGISGFPQGRGDYTAVLSDTLSYLHGNHAFKFGGEVRRFNGNSFGANDGTIGFANVTDFINAQANSFTASDGFRPGRTYMKAMGLFAMDTWKVTPYFTAELGLRWEWNMSPTEAKNRNSVFLPGKNWLVQVGTNGVHDLYQQNNKLFQPRVGISWDLFHNGKTILRSAYAVMADQPLPFTFNANPPFTLSRSFVQTTGKTRTTFGTLLADAAAGGVTLGTVQRDYHDDYIQSYNVNIQQEITPTMGLMIGYFGNKGTHMDMSVNLNQLVASGTPGTYVRPIKLAADSPLLPGSTVGNITQRSSVGTSNYNALWVTLTKRIGHGLSFNTNYTWSKSLDENSRNGLAVSDALNPWRDYGRADFDARHHFVFSGIYELPFKGNRFVEGWRLSGIVTLQSGNPINIVAGNPSLSSTSPGGTAANGNGLAPSGFTAGAGVRPDVIGTLPNTSPTIITSGTQAGNIQWFTASVCDPSRAAACPAGSVFQLPFDVVGGKNVYHFGNLRRNSLNGPDFKNVDFSITKTTKITERLRHELRIEAFDIFNHPNFSNPGTAAQFGSSTFGVISSTRNPTGDAGSSRQLQFAMKLIF